MLFKMECTKLLEVIVQQRKKILRKKQDVSSDNHELACPKGLKRRLDPCSHCPVLNLCSRASAAGMQDPGRKPFPLPTTVPWRLAMIDSGRIYSEMKELVLLSALVKGWCTLFVSLGLVSGFRAEQEISYKPSEQCFLPSLSPWGQGMVHFQGLLVASFYHQQRERCIFGE